MATEKKQTEWSFTAYDGPLWRNDLDSIVRVLATQAIAWEKLDAVDEQARHEVAMEQWHTMEALRTSLRRVSEQAGLNDDDDEPAPKPEPRKSDNTTLTIESDRLAFDDLDDARKSHGKRAAGISLAVESFGRGSVHIRFAKDMVSVFATGEAELAAVVDRLRTICVAHGATTEPRRGPLRRFGPWRRTGFWLLTEDEAPTFLKERGGAIAAGVITTVVGGIILAALGWLWSHATAITPAAATTTDAGTPGVEHPAVQE